MKILHVIKGMRKAAGTTTFVENVIAGLSQQGYNAEIVTSSKCLCQSDIIHIHGLWSGLLHRAACYAIHNKIPIVWSTHGMTAPWAMRHKWWKKLPAWLLYQKRDLRQAEAIHCTTDMEVGWNKALGFKNCFIAPLGTKENQFHSSTHNSNFTHTLLFVGRIHPVKGLVNLVKAWALCNTKGWKLRIVGPDQAGHLVFLQSLVSKMSLVSSVEFPGPKFGDELIAEYDNCDCLVLPSFTENFGATIVDALSHSKPCIASIFTPWGDLTQCGCGWWVSNDPREMSLVISEMMSLSNEERAAMGARGRKLVEEKYTWKAVVNAMVKGYEEIFNGRT